MTDELHKLDPQLLDNPPIVPYTSIEHCIRDIAGMNWRAQQGNTRKFPCLRCRGRGTLEVPNENFRRACDQCHLTGHMDQAEFETFYHDAQIVRAELLERWRVMRLNQATGDGSKLGLD